MNIPVDASKGDLRTRVRQRRAERSEAERATLSAQAGEALANFIAEHPGCSVGLFLATDDEPETGDLISRLVSNGYTVFAPHSLPNKTMAWSRMGPQVRSVVRPNGIPEPDTAPDDRLTEIYPDIVVAPAAMVDETGTRLGWGQGYYDRFLAGLPQQTVVVALVFDDEVVASLPREPHDVPVTHIATPSGVRAVRPGADRSPKAGP